MSKLLGTVALVGMLAAPGLVQAQTTIGGAAAYHTDMEASGIGAYATIALPQLHENISISPNFIYYFPDGFDAWTLSGDLVYSFPVAADAPISPFVLAGINISHISSALGGVGSSSSNDIGLNLGGGVAFATESIRHIAGARFEIGDAKGFVIFGGISFPVGG